MRVSVPRDDGGSLVQSDGGNLRKEDSCVGPVGSEGGRIKCNWRPAVFSLGEMDSVTLRREGKQE